jgi:hypothetical protein
MLENMPPAGRFLKKAPQKLLQRAKRVLSKRNTNGFAKSKQTIRWLSHFETVLRTVVDAQMLRRRKESVLSLSAR